MTASMFQSEGSTPLEKFQKPLMDEAAVDTPAAALREGDAGGDHRVGILAPHLFLGALVVERQHPVVHAQVRHVPPGRGAAAPHLGRDVEQRHEFELHAAQRRGWWNRSRPVRWRSAIVSRGISRPTSAAAARSRKHGHERPGPTHRLVVVDVGEARAIGHPRIPAAWGIFE